MIKKIVLTLGLIVVSCYASHMDLHQQEKQLLAAPFSHESFRTYITTLCENFTKGDASEVLSFSIPILDEYLEGENHKIFAEERFTLLCERKGVVTILQAKEHTTATPKLSVSHSWETSFRTAVRENALVPNTFKDPITIRAYITFLIGEIPRRARITDFDKIMLNLLGCYEVDLRHVNRLREPELYRMYECFRDFYRYQRNEQLLSQVVAVKEQEMLAEAARREVEQKSPWACLFCGIPSITLPWWNRSPSSPKRYNGYEALKKEC